MVAAVCCVCLIVGLFIAFLVWVIITMIFSYPSTETKCGKLNHLWQYCATVLIVMPLAALTLNTIAYCTRAAGLTVIPGIISLAIAVWGVLTWREPESPSPTLPWVEATVPLSEKHDFARDFTSTILCRHSSAWHDTNPSVI